MGYIDVNNRVSSSFEAAGQMCKSNSWSRVCSGYRSGVPALSAFEAPCSFSGGLVGWERRAGRGRELECWN